MGITQTLFSVAHCKKAAALLESYKKQHLTLATAESCTGGLVAALFTEIGGSSAVFMGGVVAYHNTVKQKVLGVPVSVLEAHGAVSAETAAAMASGAAAVLKADIAVSTTGIAGPSGGSSEKPVGLVYISVYQQGKIITEQCHFTGDRASIRLQTVERVLELLAV